MVRGQKTRYSDVPEGYEKIDGQLRLKKEQSFVEVSQEVVKQMVESAGGRLSNIEKEELQPRRCPIKNLEIFQDPIKVQHKSIRKNQGKPMHSLVPVELEEAAAKSFTQGQEKYPKNNHFKPSDWSTPYDSLTRHLRSFWSGEDFDPDSPEHNRIHHLERAASNLAILLHNLKNNPEGDDRYRGE